METLLLNRRKFVKAWLIGNWERIRELVVRGAVFATMTIRTKTNLAEKRFALYLNGANVDDIVGLMGTQRATIRTLEALTTEQVKEIVLSTERESLLGKLVKGLGTAKTAFSLACAGVGNKGCIDTHHAKQYAHIGDTKLWNKALRRGDYGAYTTLIHMIWGAGDTALAQWKDWLSRLQEVSGYTTTHAILMEI